MSRRVFLLILACWSAVAALFRKTDTTESSVVDWAVMTGEHYHDPEREEMCRFYS